MENRFPRHSWIGNISRWAAFTVALLIFAQAVEAQPSFGIGVIKVNFDDKTVIDLYDRPADSSPARTIRFFNDESKRSWSIVDLKSVQRWLVPESLWLDYTSFVFRCLAKHKGWLQVVANNRTGKTYWIKSSPKLAFETWEVFLKGMFSVARDHRFPQKLRRSPSDVSSEVRFRGRDCFDVTEMRGDWIRVTQAGHCEERDSSFRSGWLQWRRGRTLLIQYFITS